MDNNKILLSSLAMDLTRVALAYHRGSDKVADRFLDETKRWIKEIDRSAIPEYINTIIRKISHLHTSAKDQIAEDALMYSTLLRNYSLHKV